MRSKREKGKGSALGGRASKLCRPWAWYEEPQNFYADCTSGRFGAHDHLCTGRGACLSAHDGPSKMQARGQWDDGWEQDRGKNAKKDKPVRPSATGGEGGGGDEWTHQLTGRDASERKKQRQTRPTPPAIPRLFACSRLGGLICRAFAWRLHRGVVILPASLVCYCHQEGVQ